MERLELFFGHPGCLPAFYPLFQKGFRVPVTPQGTIRSLLDRHGGRSGPDALQGIQTIFLNGMPVDDPEHAALQEGDTLALSAAMPGLVGATMRSGGLLAGLRRSITYHRETAPGRSGGGLVTVKLFNLLIQSLGPGFLERGVIIDAAEMPGLIRDMINLCGSAVEAVCEDEPVSTEALIDRAPPVPEEPMFIKAHFAQPPAGTTASSS